MTDLRKAIERARDALEPFADACQHLHPALPDDGLSLDGIEVREWRKASDVKAELDALVALLALPEAGEPEVVKRLTDLAEDAARSSTGGLLLAQSVAHEHATDLRVVLAGLANRPSGKPDGDTRAALHEAHRASVTVRESLQRPSGDWADLDENDREALQTVLSDCNDGTQLGTMVVTRRSAVRRMAELLADARDQLRRLRQPGEVSEETVETMCRAYCAASPSDNYWVSADRDNTDGFWNSWKAEKLTAMRAALEALRAGGGS